MKIPERCRDNQCPFDPTTYEWDAPYLRLITTMRENRKRAGHDLFVRYMSHEEFAALERGDELENLTDHSMKNHSTSVGFCFMPIRRKGDEFNELVTLAERAWHVAYTVVSERGHDVGVVFEDAGCALTKGEGMYPDYYDDCGKWVTEYSTTHYSRETMRPVAVAYYDGEWMYK